MKQRSCKPSKWNDIWTKIKNVYYWLCFVLVVLTFIAIILQIIYMQAKRHRVTQDPVETEAIVTHIGESTRWVGPTIYYKYQVNGSTLQGNYCPGQLLYGEKAAVTIGTHVTKEKTTHAKKRKKD